MDFVSAEARRAGAAAAKYVKDEVKNGEYKAIKNGLGITYTVPQKFRVENIEKTLEVFMRVNNIYKNMRLQVKDGEKVIVDLKKSTSCSGRNGKSNNS